MKTVLTLFKKDVYRFLSDKPALLLTFILPAVLILIFGEIFSGSGGQQSRIPIIFVNESSSSVAKIIEDKLDSSKALKPVKQIRLGAENRTVLFNAENAKNYVKEGKFSTAIILPKDFISDSSASMNIVVYYDPKDAIEYSLITGNIQEIIYSTIPSVFPTLLQNKWKNEIGTTKAERFRKSMSKTVSEYFGVSSDSVAKYMSLPINSRQSVSSKNSPMSKIFSELINFKSNQVVGKEISNPGATRTVGGWAIMFLLFSIVGASISLFEEKQQGTLKRLLTMPVSRNQIIWSKYLYTTLLGIIQLTVMFLFAWAVFNVDIFSNLFNLSLMIIASTLAAVSFGMLITSFAKSLNQANGISTILILTMSAIGGSWFPVFLLPEWMQTISKTTITYWSVDGFLQVLWRHGDFSSIIINLAVLLGIAAAVNSIALYRFKKTDILK